MLNDWLGSFGVGSTFRPVIYYTYTKCDLTRIIYTYNYYGRLPIMSNVKKKKRGRPTSQNPKVRMPDMLVEPERLERYKEASRKSKHKTFSAWVRDTLDKEAK